MLGVPVRLRDAATLDDLVASHRVATRPSSAVRSIRDLRAAPGPSHTELMNRSLHPMIDDMTTAKHAPVDDDAGSPSSSSAARGAGSAS